MPKITKNEEQLTKELEVAMRKLYRTLPGTAEEKIQTLRTKFESEMQQLIQPSQLEKKLKKREPTEEMKSILDLLRKLELHAQIAEQYGKHHSYISAIAKRNGIYSPKAVRQELRQESSKGLSNEELATKMGVYPEAIERVRKELEQGEIKGRSKKAQEHAESTEREVKKGTTEEKADLERKAAVETTQPNIEKVVEPPQVGKKITQHSQEGQPNRKNQASVKRVDTNEFFEMAKQAVDVKTMAERLEVTKGRVRLYLTMYGFWERAQVVEVLNRLSDSEIAKRSKLSIDAIKKIREQEQNKTEKRSSKFVQDNRLAIQRRQALLEKDEEKKFFAKSNSYKSIQQWEGKTGVSSYKIVIGLRRLRSIGAASAHQLKLLQDWEEENIVKVSQPRRHVNLKIDWIGYQGAVRDISFQSTKVAQKVIHFNIERLLALYEDLLTNGQYAYLCYGYIKMEEELKALELGKEKLGLREPTLLALREKIEEVQESEMQKRKPEGPTSGAGDAR